MVCSRQQQFPLSQHLANFKCKSTKKKLLKKQNKKIREQGKLSSKKLREQRKLRIIRKARKVRNFGTVLFPSNYFLFGNYGLRRAERGENMPSETSERVEN